MLIHISPRVFYPSSRYGMNVALVDIRIPELGLHLHEGEDLVVRRPYPNKDYFVACRKVGQKAIDGIFITTPCHVERYTVVARWALNSDIILTHRISYHVLDDKYDAVSDSMVLWMAFTTNGRHFDDRWPSHASEWTPASAQPRMSLFCDDGRVGELTDTVNEDGIVIERNEVFRLLTIEPERLTMNTPFSSGRLPGLSDAFEAVLEAVTA